MGEKLLPLPPSPAYLSSGTTLAMVDGSHLCLQTSLTMMKMGRRRMIGPPPPLSSGSLSLGVPMHVESLAWISERLQRGGGRGREGGRKEGGGASKACRIAGQKKTRRKISQTCRTSRPKRELKSWLLFLFHSLDVLDAPQTCQPLGQRKRQLVHSGWRSGVLFSCIASVSWRKFGPGDAIFAQVRFALPKFFRRCVVVLDFFSPLPLSFVTKLLMYYYPTTNDGMQNGSSVEIYAQCIHVFARLESICMLSWRL